MTVEETALGQSQCFDTHINKNMRSKSEGLSQRLTAILTATFIIYTLRTYLLACVFSEQILDANTYCIVYRERRSMSEGTLDVGHVRTWRALLSIEPGTLRRAA